MNVLLSKRSRHLALTIFILLFSNVSVAEIKPKTYSTKQFIHDVALLYRQHKLAEAGRKTDQSISAVLAEEDASNKLRTKKPADRKKVNKAKRNSKKLAKAKKRKVARLVKEDSILKSGRYAKFSKLVRRKNSANFNRQMTVTATAYTSHVNQTDSTPFIAAWGDRLKPGMKVIAVSRDMLNVYGLKHRSKVRIKGLDGEYLVLDKMNKRWKKKIDIYMGMDLKKAFKWGRKKVELQWN